jgi:hypothetical protein
MHTVVGIFGSRTQAEQAVGTLLNAGVPDSSIVLLTSGSDAQEIEAVRTTDAEAPGMGKTIGAYVGGVMGASAGLSLGSAAASLLVPGVGPIMAAGLGAAALLGIGGAAVGGKVGNTSEEAMDEGMPKDDVFFLRDLLKQNRSLVIVNTKTDEGAASVRSMLDQKDAENVDDARRLWESVPPEGLKRAS